MRAARLVCVFLCGGYFSTAGGFWANERHRAGRGRRWLRSPFPVHGRIGLPM